MALLIVFYGLIILALVGIAIYEHVTISTLSLPVSPALTILTILLPLLSPLTTLLAPNLFKPPRNRRALTNGTTTTSTTNHHHKPTNPLTTTILPPFLHLLQLLLTTILATLHTSHLTSPPTTDCLLSQHWRTLYQSHNARTIRAIQDTLSCCGFRSTRDMAWPFPAGSGPKNPDACAQQFGRTEACLPAWQGALRGAVGGELGVVLCVGALQVVGVWLAGRGWFATAGTATGAAMGGRGGEGTGWMAGLQRLIGGSGGGSGDGGREGGVEAGSRRPLLAGPEREGGGNGGRVVEEGYRDVVDDEETGEGEGDGEEEAGPRREGTGYGGARDGPRVEPAHHDPWAGVQRG